jgi:hypothetical protein
MVRVSDTANLHFHAGIRFPPDSRKLHDISSILYVL